MSRTGLALIVSATMTTDASNLIVREVGHQAGGFATSPRWFRNLARLLAGWNISCWRARGEANKVPTARLHAPSFSRLFRRGSPQ
jgi:hypothetical protein